MPDNTLAPAEPASLDEAWARCEAALPEGWDLELRRWGKEFSAVALARNAVHRLPEFGTNPAAALTALAEALEARR